MVVSSAKKTLVDSVYMNTMSTATLEGYRRRKAYVCGVDLRGIRTPVRLVMKLSFQVSCSRWRATATLVTGAEAVEMTLAGKTVERPRL